MLTESQRATIARRLDEEFPGALPESKIRVYLSTLRQLDFDPISRAIDELSRECERRPTAKTIFDRAVAIGGAVVEERCRHCDGKRVLSVGVYPIDRREASPDMLAHGSGILREHPWFVRHFLVSVRVAREARMRRRRVLLWCDRCQRATDPIETQHGQRWLRHPYLAARDFLASMRGWYDVGAGFDLAVDRIVADAPEPVDYPTAEELPAILAMYRNAVRIEKED